MTRRKPWIIVLLVLLCTAFALVYCGRLRRAFAWVAILWCVTAAAAVVMLYSSNGRVAVFGGSLILIAGFVALLVDAIRQGRLQSGQPRMPYQRWWSYGLLFFGFVLSNALASGAIRVYWVEAFAIPTNSMQETLLAGDRILVDKLFVDLKRPTRGSVAVFYSPDEQAITYVKRVIAIAGDTIEIKENQVFVNDLLQQEPYAAFLEENAASLQFAPQLQNYPKREVTADHVFVLGDNRWASLDSRSFGMVPVENLVGVARIIFWSREHRRERPTRENPQGQELWGGIRWERIGKQIYKLE